MHVGDAVKNEVLFYQHSSNYRVQMNQIRNPGEMLRAAIYIDVACELAKTFDIDGLEAKPIENINPAKINESAIIAELYKLESFMTRLYARNIFEIDGNLKHQFVDIDENWRTKVSTYVTHIREAVRVAEVEDKLRDAIMGRLNDLQHQIDRSRTSLDVVSDVFLAVTEALGKGAKNLEPAVKLVERIAGALTGLRRSQNENSTPKQLPAPETLGLPDLTKKPKE